MHAHAEKGKTNIERKISMRSFIYTLLVCFSLSACEIETSNNGALDGNWQLRQIDTLATMGVCDMTHSDIYWGIETDLLQVRDIDNGDLRIMFHFERRNDSLRIFNPFHVLTKDNLLPLKNDSLLQPLGIVGTEERFYVEELKSNTLQLKSLYYRLHFRKH